jgi:hypothetical protein
LSSRGSWKRDAYGPKAQWKVEENKWYHTGKLSTGLTIENAWERVKKKQLALHACVDDAPIPQSPERQRRVAMLRRWCCGL